MRSLCKSRSLTVFMVLLGALVLSAASAPAGDPHGAYYAPDNDKIFWFIQVTDLHIGARGSQDSVNLSWLVTQGKEVVNPEFIVVSGDLTDSTNGNIFGLPNGPYQAEWDEYKSILNQGNIDADNYYDLPGNHDAYNDQYFAYYRANSIQGRATGSTQISWTRDLGFGTYHFLGVNTADNTGDGFSIFWPYGDYAGLDTGELAFIQENLDENIRADLTFVFGHHPVTATGDSQDTYLYYGSQAFVGHLDAYSASLYGYGHTHRYSEVLFQGDGYTGGMTGGGIVYLNVDSLGKSTDNQFSVIAVDCNGVSTKTQAIGVWPLVLITTPVDQYVGGVANPYGYEVPSAADNPLRALVFDPGTITGVRYRIDGGSVWHTMQPVTGNLYLWESTWDGAAISEGEHTIEVQAVGTSTRSDTVVVNVAASVNQAPTANDQSVSTNEDSAVSVQLTASDPDGDALTYQVVTSPAHGTLGGTAPNLTYTPYANYNGSDSFTFKAFDGSAYSNTATVSLAIAPVNDPPTAAFTSTAAGLTVTFTDTSTDSDGSIVAWSWAFGDGSTSAAQNPSHAYSTNGTYTVTLTVTDNGGLADTHTATITVTDPATTTEMHVGNIELDLQTRSAGKNIFTRAAATIRVVDAENKPVAGATVNVSWSGATSDTDSAVTGTDGSVTVYSDEIKKAKKGTVFTCTVTDVTKSGATFVPGGGITTASITVP